MWFGMDVDVPIHFVTVAELLALSLIPVAMRFGRNESKKEKLKAMFSFEIKDWKMDIALPIVSAFIVESLTFGKIFIQPELLSFLGVVQSILVAPVFEEVCFRGLLLGWPLLEVDKRVKENARYVWYFSLIGINAILFFYVHSARGFTTLAIGLLSAAFYVWRRSLIPSILLHFFSNWLVWIEFLLV